MNPRCDCIPWNPAHEPAPTCRWGDCDQPATHLVKHKTEGDGCSHLSCGEHAARSGVLVDHDAHRLADLFPQHFAAVGAA